MTNSLLTIFTERRFNMTNTIAKLPFSAVLWQKAARRKRQGFSIMEIMIGLLVIIALAAGTFFAYNQVQESRKTATMHSDLNNITLAIQSFEALHRGSALPGALEDLVTGLAASDALDNTEHRFIQPSRFDSTASFLDPWGEPYEYNATDRTVTCTTKDISINF
jgi:type II secretory pathway pseudopilin PulG